MIMADTPKNDVKTTAPADDFILQVRHLKMYFPTQTGFFKTRQLKAVDDVSFEVKRGETLGIVGESGCGKTTLGRTILHLYEPSDGEVIFNGREIKGKKIYTHEIRDLKKEEKAAEKKVEALYPNPSEEQKKEIADKKAVLQKDYGAQITQEKAAQKDYEKDLEYLHLHAQMVFQDPYSSLDPRMTVEDIIAEPLDAHKELYKEDCQKKGITFKEFRHHRAIEP